MFVSFLAGLAAMTRFSLRDGRGGLAAVNALGALSVAFTLLVNPGRGYPLLSLAATALIALGLYILWQRAGRPTGVEELERIAESEEQSRRGGAGASGDGSTAEHENRRSRA